MLFNGRKKEGDGMETKGNDLVRTPRRRVLEALLLCVLGILLNMAVSRLAGALRLPFYLDSLGTFLVAALGGIIPGMAVGYLTNLILGISDSSYVYYGVLSVIIAVYVSYAFRRGWLRKWWGLLLTILVLALIGGGLGGILTWVLFGMDFGDGVSAPMVARIYASGAFSPFAAQLTGDLLIDLPDKAVVTLLGSLVLHLLPRAFRRRLELQGWRQKPMTPEEVADIRSSRTRQSSLRYRMVFLISGAMFIIAVVSAGICFLQFHQETIGAQTRMGESITSIASDSFDRDRVEEYMALGETAPGYIEAEERLTSLLNSSEDIEYVYVYQIREDGCHVVFDLDTEDTPGGEPGELVPFDESFLPYLDDLLKGNPIEPIISNDSFGWLLTIYTPVYDSAGRCICYAAADISMAQLLRDEYSYIAKIISLFLGFFIMILALGLWLAEYNLILPINSMARAAGAFAFQREAVKDDEAGSIRALEIRTGDEIENLYQAFSKTSEDMLKYIADVRHQNETISRMQSSLIAVLADMVESRDKYTGDHVMKTSAYSEIVMREMKKEGIYPDQLTDTFIADVIQSAPLHDVGKIVVSDTILNKPGKLTDEEFAQMKNHTLAGKEIIERSTGAVAEPSYLDEAQNLAAFHHERWDGSGYPYGLKGEEIPLSARIMAVADVFDALVSRRSYKEGFPEDKALGIIREGIGTHFDPKVAGAFLNAEAEVRRVAEEKSGEGTGESKTE